jgi:hypothetical protein
LLLSISPQAQEAMKMRKENELLKVEIDRLKRKVNQVSRENETLKAMNDSKNPEKDILKQLLERMTALDMAVNVRFYLFLSFFLFIQCHNIFFIARD